LYFAFVSLIFKAKCNDLAWLQVAKTIETLPSAQFAIHDVSTWAIKGFYPQSLALALIICLLTIRTTYTTECLYFVCVGQTSPVG
jgi:hypothetical protein